jgi:hypothetical protein
MKSGLTYGVDITSRTQLIDGLDSQRVFFDDEAKLHELEPSVNPFITMLLGMGTAKKKASGDLESYVEHRGSYINDPLYYIKASDTTAIAALAANAAEYSGMAVSLTPGGAAIDPHPFKAGDVMLLVDPTDETKTATIIMSDTDDADEFKFKLLTRTPGFNFIANAANATKLYHVGRAFAEGSDESDARYEKPVTFWNEVGSFKESYSITDQLAATTQIVYGNEKIKQLAWAQMRLLRDVDSMLLFASQRLNASNPFASPGASPLLNADGEIIRTSVSMEQAIRAAETVGIGGSRLYKMTATTVTPDIFDANVIEATRYGSNHMCFAGPGFVGALASMARRNSQYQLLPGETKFGIKLKKYVTPYADMDIAIHKGMKGRLDKAMFMVDMSKIQLRQLIPMYSEPLVTNKTMKKWEMRWDIGLRTYFPEAHSLWFMV